MPLSPLPEDNTKRYKLLYAVAGQNHSMQSRCSDAQDDSTAVGHMTAIAASVLTFVGDNVSFLGVSVALAGSNVFNPVGGFTPVTGSGATLGQINFPRAICFPGRTTGGRKTKVFLFGAQNSYNTPNTYEEDPLTTSELQGFQGLLNSQTDFWLGIDGIKPTWYFRMTIKQNDHYVDAQR
jgi:hypothetical protein